MSKKHLVLPDVQIKPGVDNTYLGYIGKYAAEKKPDVIVCIGDFADLPSLSSYDVGKKSFEGRMYKADIQATVEAMEVFMAPIKAEVERTYRNKKKHWNPRLVLTLGNHENRINRVIQEDRKWEGHIGVEDLQYEKFGWEVHDFLEVVVIDGVAYSHYFTSGVMGRPVTTAQALLTKKHMSCFAGHQQGRQIACAHKADGSQITAIISGSCYEHDEDYLGPQGNKHWRGFWVLHNVKDGSFDEMPVSLDYIRKKYDKT
jgi:hypothetical protein